jgi:hypothetical protein
VTVKQIQYSAAQRSATRADKSVRADASRFREPSEWDATAWLFVAAGVCEASRWCYLEEKDDGEAMLLTGQ